MSVSRTCLNESSKFPDQPIDLETVDYFDVNGVINFKKKNSNDVVEMTVQIKADYVPMLPGSLESTAESTVKATLERVFKNALQTIADNMDTFIKYDNQQTTQKVAV